MANHLYDALFAPHAGAATDFLRFADGSRMTHGAFLDLADRHAAALAAAGLVAGDRLVLQLDKSPGMLATVAAAIRLGVVFVPLNPAYTAAEVAYFLGDTGARLFLCPPARAAELAPAARDAGAALRTLDATGGGDFAAAVAGPAPPVAARGADDLAALLYTSGTTGRSKGAMLTQGNLLSNARTLVAAWGFTRDDVLLHALPVFHTHGLFVATNVALLAGCPMIFLPRFDAAEVAGLLPQATAMMGVPTFYTRLLDQPGLAEAARGRRLFVSGSAPLLAETHRAWEARTGHRILERYGMTETNMNTSNPLDGERRPGSVGPALPGVEVRVCDAAGNALPTGRTGVVEVRGSNVFRGYWRMPDKTRDELRPDGFFITGDLGTLSDDGYLTIVGRAKDLIISGGLNVYPKEVEEAIDALPGVAESAVVGVPHPDFGEAVVAVVAGGDAAPDEAAVLAALAGRLARFKQPKRVIRVRDLPRNAMGKVQKAELRRIYADLFVAP